MAFHWRQQGAAEIWLQLASILKGHSARHYKILQILVQCVLFKKIVNSASVKCVKNSTIIIVIVFLPKRPSKILTLMILYTLAICNYLKMLCDYIPPTGKHVVLSLYSDCTISLQARASPDKGTFCDFCSKALK